ncbi:MAG: alcohol dehydrogenase catalytic domain-containing protein [Acidaminococcaceae bacterium]|nr:alcohol dehydrogenase catalytic domain-containing protein [Acidaminococcaceae bacterium]
MNGMMKCVIKAAPGPGNLELVERAIPQVGPNDVLVKVHSLAVCGTDVHIMHWNEFASTRMTPPTIIGHEFSGEVVGMRRTG